jgi:hypothetical protein
MRSRIKLMGLQPLDGKMMRYRHATPIKTILIAQVLGCADAIEAGQQYLDQFSASRTLRFVI